MFSKRLFLSLMSRATFFMAFKASSTSLKSLELKWIPLDMSTLNNQDGKGERFVRTTETTKQIHASHYPLLVLFVNSKQQQQQREVQLISKYISK